MAHDHHSVVGEVVRAASDTRAVDQALGLVVLRDAI
jgi:hypothetical protein